jgi:hypothetical protein
MYDELVDAEEISCMICDGTKGKKADEELALFMQRFNLDRETVETMPAFEKHCKLLFCSELDK